MSRFQAVILAAERAVERNVGGGNVRQALNNLADALRAFKAARAGGGVFEVQAGVNYKTGAAFVEVAGPELPITMPAADARALGLNILEGAVHAEYEALVIAQLKEIGLSLEECGAFLASLRARRDRNE